MKTAAEVDFKANKLRLYQGDKTRTAPVQEETCNKEEEIKKSENQALKY